MWPAALAALLEVGVASRVRTRLEELISQWRGAVIFGEDANRVDRERIDYR